MTVAWLQMWGLGKEAAELVISELTTNAVRYAGNALVVSLTDSAEGLEVGVLDGATEPAKLEASAPSDDAEGGRGLLLVQALSRRWGQRREAAGNFVWALLDRVPAEVAA